MKLVACALLLGSAAGLQLNARPKGVLNRGGSPAMLDFLSQFMPKQRPTGAHAGIEPPTSPSACLLISHTCRTFDPHIRRRGDHDLLL